jgi:hypothetical protein
MSSDDDALVIKILYDLSHLPIILDDEVARVIDNGWRGATPEEVERISQVFIDALVAGTITDG